jgi:hypothetical protein
VTAAIRRWNARRRSPSIRALRQAGPPTWWLVIAAPLSLIPIVALFAAGVDNLGVFLAMPFLAFALVGLLDRKGWHIRMAMTEVAARQRERWQWGTIPIDPISAEAWLAAHTEAPPAARAAVLATTGRHEEARALVDAASAETPLEAVALARLRILFAAEARGDHSISDAVAALDAAPELAAVPPEERRSQRLALAWSLAWLRIRAGEPWRDDFAAVVEQLAPFRVSRRYQAWHVTQHYALPIAYALALLIVSALGLLDVLLQG